MLMAFFVIPLLIYAALFIFKPNWRERLAFWGAATAAFISLAAFLVTIYNADLWSNGERIVWAGVKSKTGELTVGGNIESASIGWANEAFAPEIKATLRGAQTDLEISGGAGFVFDEKKGEYLNGEIVPPNAPKTFGGYKFQKREGFFCGDYLQISQGENLLVEINLPNVRKDRVYNLDSAIEKATQNLTAKGDRQSSWLCSTASAVKPAQRLPLI